MIIPGGEGDEIGTWNTLRCIGRGLRLVFKAHLFRYVTKSWHEIGGWRLWSIFKGIITFSDKIDKYLRLSINFTLKSLMIFLSSIFKGIQTTWKWILLSFVLRSEFVKELICFSSLLYKYFKTQVSGIRSREPPGISQVYGGWGGGLLSWIRLLLAVLP